MMNVSNTSSIAMRYGNGSGGGLNPFTPNQWQELEHQALIYKYLFSGIPVPPGLLFPLDRSLSCWSCYHHQYHRTMSILGSTTVDPEPGRCRRTDGKKWRCSKEAYPDSKYCKRHMHRGKNRSRKHVEHHQQQQHRLMIPSNSNATSNSFAAIPLLPGRNSTSTISLCSLDATATSLIRSLPPETNFHHTYNYLLDSETRYASYGDSSSIKELTPLGMSFSSSSRSPQDDHSYLKLQCLGDYYYPKYKETNKTIHRFFDEDPIRGGNKDDSWLNRSKEKSSNGSTTELFTSMLSSTSNNRFHQLFNSMRNNSEF